MFPKIKNVTNNIFNNERENNMIVTNYNNFQFGNNNKPSSKRKNIHSTRNAKNNFIWNLWCK